jgi:hypothetical protein
MTKVQVRPSAQCRMRGIRLSTVPVVAEVPTHMKRLVKALQVVHRNFGDLA